MPGYSFSTEFGPGIRLCSHTALQAAAARVSYENTKILLHAEANVDLEGRKFGTALRVASAGGHKFLAGDLPLTGADPDRNSKDHGSAL